MFFLSYRDGNLLLTGPNGSGKTSICRILCGLWPCAPGCGVFSVPARIHGLVYVPQRPYLCVGSLREQLTYPFEPHSTEIRELLSNVHRVEQSLDGLDKVLANLLQVVGLSALLDRTYAVTEEGCRRAARRQSTNGKIGERSSQRILPADDPSKVVADSHSVNRGWDAVTAWEETLSLGEQQRLGMARLFFRKPSFAIMDECTNATSVDIEDLLYRQAEKRDIRVITVSQRPALTHYHSRELHLVDGVYAYH